MTASNVALSLGWVVAFGGGTLMLVWRQTGDALNQVLGGFDKWSEHLRGCPARKLEAEADECICGLTEFRDAIEGD